MNSHEKGSLPAVGVKVRYMGGDEHENSGHCLTIGKVYEVAQIGSGLGALLVTGHAEYSAIKDDSPYGHWAIHEENVEFFEIVSE